MKLGIRTKIVLITVVILFFSYGANALAGGYIFAGEYSDDLESEALIIGQNLALQLGSLLSSGTSVEEVVAFESQCQAMVSRYEEISYAMVVDVDGKVLFHNDPLQRGQVLVDAAMLEAVKSAQDVIRVYSQRGERYYDATIPVFDVSGRHVAAVKVGLLAKSTAQRALELAAHSVAMAFVSLGLATILLLFALSVWVTNPLAKLLTAVQGVGKEKEYLAQRVEIDSKDEVGQLAFAFNGMSEQIHELISGLEQGVAERTHELEATAVVLAARGRELEDALAELQQREAELQKAVRFQEEARRRQERSNRELQIANEATRRRSTQLQATAAVSRAITQVRDPDELLSQVTQLIGHHFGFYHVGIFLVDEAGRNAVLRAANSPGGERMLARGHRLEVGGKSIVGYVTGTRRPRIALDVGADVVYFGNPDLPETRSEMALPLRWGDEIVGALDVQSTEVGAFDDQDVAVLQALADQVSIALENARVFSQAQVALAEAEAVHRRYLQQEWARYMQQATDLSHEYVLSGREGLVGQPLPAGDAALVKGATVAFSAGADRQGATLAVPIKLRDQVIGVLDLQEVDADRSWSEEEIALAEAVAEQLGLALENARLFEQTQARVRRETLTRQITERIRDAMDVDAMLQIAIRELGRVLGAPRVYVRLGVDAGVDAEEGAPVSSVAVSTDPDGSNEDQGGK